MDVFEERKGFWCIGACWCGAMHEAVHIVLSAGARCMLSLIENVAGILQRICFAMTLVGSLLTFGAPAGALDE